MEKLYKFSEVKLTYNSKVKLSSMPSVKFSKDVYELLQGIYDEDKVEHKEMFYLLLINRDSRLLGWSKISEGGITGTVCDVRIIMQAALLSNATSMILSHNHPSGTLSPSVEDRKITEKIKQCCEIMDIRLLDHIIYTKEGYYSFEENREIK